MEDWGITSGDIKLHLWGCCWAFFSDLLTLCWAGAQLFKLSGCWSTGPHNRTSCGFGTLAPTCDASLWCGLLKDHRNIFHGFSLHRPRRDPQRLALISSGAKSPLGPCVNKRCCWVFFAFQSQITGEISRSSWLPFSHPHKFQTFRCFLFNWINSKTDFRDFIYYLFYF